MNQLLFLIKRSFAVLFLVLTLAVTLSADPTESRATAPTPRFNFLSGDAEMLRGAKSSDAGWTDPVSASIGSRVAVLFYYHNGIVGSTAHHTKLRVDLPMEQSNQLVLNSFLWSQETQYITNTVVNGSIVGRSGLTINLPTSGRVEYVAGSTKWFPNGTQTGTPVPDGIVSASGLDIGDINGCWQYAGYVSFLVDIKGEAKLVMDKKVAHPSDATWQDEIMAWNGEEVVYHLGIRNEGDIDATSVTVKDQLPSYMSYVSNTTKLFTKDYPNGTPLSDTIFSTGVSLPPIGPGQDNVIYITYRTKIASAIPSNICGALALNNVAKVYMAGVEQDMDQAKVTVRCQERKLSIEKKVKSGTSWVDTNQADLGDTLEYKITIKNIGNVALSAASVRDVLPLYVDYIPGSTRINGQTVGDQLVTSGGFLLGDLDCNEEIIITFCGRVYGCPPVGGYVLQNTAYVKAQDVAEISATARTNLQVTPPQDPSII